MSEISVQQFYAHIQKGLGSLYVLCGEEPLQRFECADTIRRRIRAQGEVDRSSFTVAGAHFNWGGVSAAFSGLSLFAQQQLVEVHIPSGKPGKEGGAILQQLAQTLSTQQDVCLLVVLPQALDRTMKSAVWFKALNQYGVVVNCSPIDLQLLPQWLTRRMAQAGMQLKSGEDGKKAISFLVDHVEGNLLAAHQEIEKMALLYAVDSDSPHEIGYEEVKKVVSNVARYDLFELPKTMLLGQMDRAVKMLDGLINEGQAAVRIHWVLANEILALWRVRELLDHGKPMPLALREARVWGERERLFERIVPRVSLRSCLKLLRYAKICDGIVKGIYCSEWPTDAQSALCKLMLSVIDVVDDKKKS